MIELKAIVEEYENDISLRHIGFPEDWYEQLENRDIFLGTEEQSVPFNVSL